MPGTHQCGPHTSESLEAAQRRLQAVRQHLDEAAHGLAPIATQDRTLAQELEAVDTLRIGYEFRGNQITRMQQRIATLQAELIDLRAQAGTKAGEDLAVALARIDELQSLIDKEG
ncbi:MAG: hypothetical protein KDB86_11315 [Actinobacteria bacterium]|nr:hypothetical protein [Actinomycetota bacterium]MCB9388174.1 hypothetical protein [Acidimicrobiia bacterium]